MVTALSFSLGKSLSRFVTATQGCFLSVRLKLVSHTTCKKGTHPCNSIHWHIATTFVSTETQTSHLDLGFQSPQHSSRVPCLQVNYDHLVSKSHSSEGPIPVNCSLFRRKGWSPGCLVAAAAVAGCHLARLIQGQRKPESKQLHKLPNSCISPPGCLSSAGSSLVWEPPQPAKRKGWPEILSVIFHGKQFSKSDGLKFTVGWCAVSLVHKFGCCQKYSHSRLKGAWGSGVAALFCYVRVWLKDMHLW